MRRHDDRVSSVTGAGTGIGAAIACRLADEGLAVAVLDRDPAGASSAVDSIVKAVGRAIAVAADVSSAEEIARAVAAVCAELGRPTVLVNNAGITRDNLIFRMTREDWATVMAVYPTGAFLMISATQGFMVDAGGGRIVNMSSVVALGNGVDELLRGEGRTARRDETLAVELGCFGVTVNAIAPGFVNTEMTGATARRLGVSFEELTDQYVREIPVGRAGEPHDTANAAAFFIDQLSGYVSGRFFAPPVGLSHERRSRCATGRSRGCWPSDHHDRENVGAKRQAGPVGLPDQRVAKRVRGDYRLAHHAVGAASRSQTGFHTVTPGVA
jgi:3-oxoacyl-[acyl-carrier protein] reductase